MAEEEEEDIICDLPNDTHPPPSSSARPNLLRQVLTHSRPPLPINANRQKLKNDFSPISWNEFFDEKRSVSIGENVFNVYLKGFEGPIFYFLHGGGYSGLTWSCLTKELTNRINCRIVAPDLRGHGDTVCVDNSDLCTKTQTQDIGAIFTELFGRDSTNLDVCIVGHSMGGALAIHTIRENVINASIVGLVVIDVVEGSAMEALSGMVHFLHSRPATFESKENAIKWCLTSGTARNVTAARVSMPSQIRKIGENEYTWRIDLTATEPYWKGWFEGLSAQFLASKMPKLLVLAGVDRLDRDLTIGQMQGKFQTCVLPKVGHCVQEDSPDQLAEELARFATRYRFAQPTAQFNSPAPFHRPAALGNVL